MKKILVTLFLVSLYQGSSFAGQGTSEALEEGERKPLLSSRPIRVKPQEKWGLHVEEKMKEIAKKDPLSLDLEDKRFVDLANSLGHPTAVHIIKQYYSSQSSYRVDPTSHQLKEVLFFESMRF